MSAPSLSPRPVGTRLRATAPGRVNLIGEHTDYTGGLVLPMAIDLATTIDAVVTDATLDLVSDTEPEALHLDLPVAEPAAVRPVWGRYVAAVATRLGAHRGLSGTISSTVPVGSGLSSSAALEVASALALGAAGDPAEVAALCQAAEGDASGVPCGIMDQLASTAGTADHALMIDCESLEITPVPIPGSALILVVHSGERRRLAGSEYATRRAECELAAASVGPLRQATADDVSGIEDPVVRRRARHVISENERVRECAEAFGRGDLRAVGAAMTRSHASLRDDFEVSTPTLDALVDQLCGLPGIWGARLTGAGFGGCVVALCDRRSDPQAWSTVLAGRESWTVRPAEGASVRILES